MSQEANPYQSPEAVAVPVNSPIVQGYLTANMLIYLKGASPWLRFIGILGFVSAGLAAISGLVSFIFVPLAKNIWSEIPGFEMVGILGLVFGGGIAVLCIGAGVLMFFPSLFIYRFGEKIRSYLRTGTEHELEQAFRNNKSFWKFTGIICIVYLAFIPMLIIGSIIAALVTIFI